MTRLTQGRSNQRRYRPGPRPTPPRRGPRSGRYRIPCRRRLASTAAGLCLAPGVLALPWLSEIHYNSPAPGADPDEFIELSNVLDREIDLGGYRFVAGIDFEFAAGAGLAARSTLILARDPAGFAVSFPDYSGPLYDFAGALSNSGETLTLEDGRGQVAWSIRYDDSGLWPRGADGQGLSLQRVDTIVNGTEGPERWFAAAPNPGAWNALHRSDPGGGAQTVGSPSPLTLLLCGLLFGLGLSDTRRSPRVRNTR